MMGKTKVKSSIRILRLSMSILVLFYSCQGLNNQYIELGSNYWFTNTGGGIRIIESKLIPSYKKIYPEIVDYNHNDEFIIAKQKIRSDLVIQLMGEDIFRRVKNYQQFKKTYSVFYDTIYKLTPSMIQEDSLLYRQCLLHSSDSVEESNLRVGCFLLASNIQAKASKHNDYNYWIILKSADSIIGPLSKTQYLNTRQNLNISSNLVLEHDQ